MNDEQRDRLLIAIAQVLVQVIYRDEGLRAADRQRFATFLAVAITTAGGEPYPFG